MRYRISALLASVMFATPAYAENSLLAVNPGLLIWTIIAFAILVLIVSKLALPPMLAAVKAREEALEEAIAKAAKDREEAAAILAEQRRALDASRAEADKLIQEGRAAGEKVRSTMVEDTRKQQQEMLERARREIESEKDRAISELRREAVDLALAGASKVIERNLDDAGNRALVESFLASINTKQKS